MFTGIIEELGTVTDIKKETNLIALSVRAEKMASAVKLGDSIAIDGVCLTVVKKINKLLTFEVMKETIDRTTMAFFKTGQKVNLERALKADGRLDGHFVMGHVDDVVSVKAIIDKPNYLEIQFNLDKSMRKYLVPKGSVCINGVSLTVGKVQKNYFSVYLIPYTRKLTSLGLLSRGDVVNIEIDILAKYILKYKTNE